MIFTTYGVNDYVIEAELLKPNEWAHIAVSLDASNDASFYVNGQPAGFVPAFAPGQSTTRPLHIGVCPVDPSQNWNGVIDELRIWNKVRSKTEIQNDMSRRLTGSESNLVAYWNFDEGQGSVLGDSTQNHLDGVLYNSPLWVISKQTPGYFFDVLGIFARDDTDTTVTLYGYDADGDPLKAYITQLPEAGYGEVYQFAGSGPVRGAKITDPDTLITDPQMRLVFAPEDLTQDYETILRWKVFDDVVYSNNPTTYTLTVRDCPPLTEEDFLDHFLGKGAIPEYRFIDADLNQDGIIGEVWGQTTENLETFLFRVSLLSLQKGARDSLNPLNISDGKGQRFDLSNSCNRKFPYKSKGGNPLRGKSLLFLLLSVPLFQNELP